MHVDRVKHFDLLPGKKSSWNEELIMWHNGTGKYSEVAETITRVDTKLVQEIVSFWLCCS